MDARHPSWSLPPRGPGLSSQFRLGLEDEYHRVAPKTLWQDPAEPGDEMHEGAIESGVVLMPVCPGNHKKDLCISLLIHEFP